MIIYKLKDSVWINTIQGVTVYFSYNPKAGYMVAKVQTPCGVPQIETFGNCKSISDGRQQIANLTQKDADRLFDKIFNWKGNKEYGLDNFKLVSLTEPFN